MQRNFNRDDQLVALFLMVLAANAVVSYPYVKDVVMSPAGAFLAVAAFVAARNLLAVLPSSASPRVASLLVAGFALLGTTWGIRVIGTYAGLRTAAHVDRNEWAYAEMSQHDDGVAIGGSGAALFQVLRDDAIFVHPPPPPLSPPLRALFMSE